MSIEKMGCDTRLALSPKLKEHTEKTVHREVDDHLALAKKNILSLINKTKGPAEYRGTEPTTLPSPPSKSRNPFLSPKVRGDHSIKDG